MIEISRMKKHREEMTNSAGEAEEAQRGGKMGSMKHVNIRDVPTRKLFQGIQSKCQYEQRYK